MPNSEDSALVSAARRDPHAFAALYERYVGPLYRYLYSRTGCVPAAEDLTAQTFLAALESLPRYRDDGHFAAWLFAIARRKTVDYYRQQRRLVPIAAAEMLPSQEDDPPTEAIHSESRAALTRLLAALSREERDLLDLRYVAGLKFSEIARLLERKEDTVKKIFYRLIERLQEQLASLREVPHA
jgi:RNA polymerase sigma-70 factor, ECF subfamily